MRVESTAAPAPQASRIIKPNVSEREGTITAEIDQLPLHSDTYRASLFLGDATQDYDEKRDAVEFDYVSSRFYPQTPRLDAIGSVDLSWRWSIEPGSVQ